MLARLEQLARVCTRVEPTPSDVVEACALVRDLLGAEDAYVIRGADPHFLRVGCLCPTVEYEIKQRGYWLVWRMLVGNPQVAVGMFDSDGGLVSAGKPLMPGAAASHAAMVLPGEEAFSDMLVVHGPWPEGISQDQAGILVTVRPMLAVLSSAVLDVSRRARQREQLDVLSTVAGAFSRARRSEEVLISMATSLAKASAMDWVAIVTYNEACDAVVDRALNVARHSETATADRFRQPSDRTRANEVRVGVELAARDGRILIRDAAALDLADEPALELIRDDIPGLQRWWRRSHISSVAILPITFEGAPVGHIVFHSSSPRTWAPAEVEFLEVLCTQAATAIQGLRLYRALQHSEEELRRNEERFRSLVQNASDLITVVAGDGTITYQSPSIEPMLGYRAEAVVGRRLQEFLHGADAGRALAAMHAASMAGRPRAGGDVRIRHRDGSWRHVEFIGTDQRGNPAIGGFVLNIRDVTDRKMLEQQLIDQAVRDPLTRLLNRRGFAATLDEAAEPGAQELAVLFLDIDNFKSINDRFGHTAGDRLLRDVGERLQGCVRPGDTVARLGGDEFAVLLRGPITAEKATDVAVRALAEFEPPFRLEGLEVAIRASVGVAHGGAGGELPDGETLLRRADLAMYAAKARGKACYQLFDPAMLSAVVSRRELGAEIAEALLRDEFVLHYQPMVALEGGELFGLEALVRWRHPERGLVAPSEFVPLSEETGAIVPLGAWVLAEACRAAASWDRGHGAPGDWTMSVNVSVKQLQHPGFLDDLRGALGRSGFPSGRLMIEVTEGSMIQDPGTVLARLTDVRALGVRVALDDFATGYSSLSYLRDFPVDLIKIDRSFVANVANVAADQELVRAIIELGRALGIAVVAEGIERDDQLARLRELECPVGQGFYFDRPLDAAAAGALLARIARSGGGSAEAA